MIINNSHVFFMPHFGLTISGTILVGEHIGAKHIAKAKRFHNILQVMGFIQSLVLGLVFLTLRFQIAEFYTNIVDL